MNTNGIIKDLLFFADKLRNGIFAERVGSIYEAIDLLKTYPEKKPDDNGLIEKALADWRSELNNISDKMGLAKLLAQLAEETAELGQAALKLRRALDGTNPTPVTAPDAILNLQEEMADTLLLMLMVGFDPSYAERTIRRKIPRWIGRIDHDEDSDCPARRG